MHIAIDDASRVGYVQILRDEQADRAVAFLRGAVACYAAVGVVIREVLTDNGSCFRSRGLAGRQTRPQPKRPIESQQLARARPG